MILKRLIAIVLALCLTLSLTVTAFAVTMNVAATPVNVGAGEDVTVTLTLDQAIEDVTGLGFNLYFNSDLFTLKSSTEGTMKPTSVVKVDSTGSYYGVSFVDTTGKGQTISAGTACTFVFTAKSDVTGNKNATFSVKFEKGTNSSFGKITSDVGPAVTVTVKGAHVHDYTKVNAVAATCVKDGNIEYYTCTCGKYFKLVDEKYVEISKADTVISKTTAEHKLTHVPAVVPTNCSTDAVAEHWKCSVCGKLFSDAAGKTETTLAKLTTPAKHLNIEPVAKVDATCTKDGMEAHYKCTACGKLFTDKDGKNATTADALKIPAAHKLSKVVKKNATCTEDGMEAHYKCSVCEKLFTDAAGKTETTAAALKIPAAHSIVAVVKKDATCTEDGYEAHFKCTVCKKLFSDKDGKNPLAAPVAIKAAHKLVKVDAKPSTCLVEGWSEYYKCSVCGKLFSDAAGEAGIAKVPTLPLAAHTPGAGYAYDGTNHWQFCTVCGEKLNVTKHTPNIEEPTENEAQSCTVCGAVLKNATGGAEHTHGILDGWKFDDNYHWHACRTCNEQLDKVAHSFGSWIIDKEATSTTTGLKHATCSVCGYVKQEVISKNSSSNSGNSGSSTTNKPVESQKTFDAGIALYAGMAVLSLTGSAWMIGKKKEH